MKRHRLLMTLSAFALLAFGLYQIAEALVYYRPMEKIETHKFIHQFAPLREGLRYEALYDKAVTFREDVADLTVHMHLVVGGAAVIMGALVLALLADTRSVGHTQSSKAAEAERGDV